MLKLSPHIVFFDPHAIAAWKLVTLTNSSYEEFGPVAEVIGKV